LICCLFQLAIASGCASPVSRHISPPASVALGRPQETKLGRQVLEQAASHGDNSGYYLLNAGVDGLATRIQIIRGAERTLDLQYYIFRGDDAGFQVAEELRHAADRGVRVRLLVDDGDTTWGDERILQLDGYPNIQVRVFNPFDYRGHNRLWRNIDFIAHKSRLDYRMHNKLLVADNAIALIGGRNIGNQYFQIDPDSQFADDDIFVAGPVSQTLSAAFDEFWNSDLAVPAAPLATRSTSHHKASSGAVLATDYLARINSGEPYASLIDGRRQLEWASARVVHDSPHKRDVEARLQPGSLMSAAVEEQIGAVKSELLMMSPYFVPSKKELALLHQIRSRAGEVSVLSNSLESAPTLAAQSGYEKVRVPLLQDNVRLYEVRARLLSSQGSGQTRNISRYGNYALHAKLYVFDRQRFFAGSWNYDQRSLLINTEIGILIDDGALASQVARRFDEMTAPSAAYALHLSQDASGKPIVAWRTEEGHQVVDLTKEPARGWWQRLWIRVLTLLPLQPEL
jgi:putative cardiolipin synthase